MSATDRKILINYKLTIRRYLIELNELCLEKPLENKLLSLEKTEHIQQVSFLKRKPARKIRIYFEEKTTDRFKKYVTGLHRANPNSVYIWTENSNSCGLFEISSLLNFNFGFGFGVNTQGIVALLTSDLTDSLVLDFSHGGTASGQELEIDVSGDRWPAVNY
ncbi:hypothetical protein [Massilia sp. Root418]|jgi:hypothetical protein|uniref:hypothetical protein n=1 Tax=Massilia sp. Root418 TaxID=1736532 RepID=UPI0012F6246D|nr:hypothetical protein [Massilia sp. Root418]